MIEVRKLTENDLPKVYEIEQAAHALAWTRGIFNEYLEEGFLAYVLEAEGEIVSFAFMDMVGKEANIINISVSPEHQRKGYGKMLLKHLLQMAKDNECESLFLEVRESNTAAKLLYENMGFRVIDTKQDYFPAAEGREDALVLAMSLENNNNK